MQRDRKQLYGLWLFGAIAILILAQVGWWTTLFLNDVDLIANLRRENRQEEELIRRESFHRRLMFASESITFAGLVCVGLFLLYRALGSERHSRLIQRNFIETVSHESKTPLTALKLLLESAEEKWPADKESRQDLESAKAQVRRLSALMEKALYLNRLERDVFRFEPLLLSDAVNEVLKRIDPLLKEKKIAVHSFLENDMWVKADIFALQTSIQSLIENAAIYNQASEKRIWIRAWMENDKAVLDIVDNGTGIPEADRPFIFDRFYRGSGNSRIPGTGLGLYLARKIVEAHHGILRVLAPEKGLGARFEIRLPRGKEAST